MNVKKIVIVALEVFLTIISGTMLILFIVNISGMGASKIYSDSGTYWMTSLIPFGGFLITAIVIFYLHKKKQKMIPSSK